MTVENRYSNWVGPVYLLFIIGLLAVSVFSAAEMIPAQMADGTGAKVFLQTQRTPADEEVTRRIREALQDQTLSPEARNIVVITKDGTVTLRGQVVSALEREAVENKVAQAAGQNAVQSKLRVTP